MPQGCYIDKHDKYIFNTHPTSTEKCDEDAWQMGCVCNRQGKLCPKFHLPFMGPYNSGPNLTAGPFNAGLDNADFKLCGI